MNERDTRIYCDEKWASKSSLFDEFPIAMAYVRWQKLDQMYQPEFALQRGTLYPELDKPFCGKTITGGKR